MTCNSTIKVIDLDRYDPHGMRGFLADWSWKIWLLSPGPFHGRIVSYGFKHCLLESGLGNPRLRIMGTLPRDRVTLAYAISCTEAGVLNQWRVSPHSLMVFPPGAPFDHIQVPNLRWATLKAPPSVFESFGFPLPLDRFAFYKVSNRAGMALQKKLILLLDKATELRDQKTDMQALEEEVVGAFVDVASYLSTSEVEDTQQRYVRKMKVIRQAEEYIERHIDGMIRIGDLVAATGMNQRSLEYVFKEMVDMSPRQYITVMRLNRAYESFCDAVPDETSVGMIMRHVGITHPGRFAADYNRMFGEFPSKSLQRSCL